MEDGRPKTWKQETSSDPCSTAGDGDEGDGAAPAEAVLPEPGALRGQWDGGCRHKSTTYRLEQHTMSKAVVPCPEDTSRHRGS